MKPVNFKLNINTLTQFWRTLVSQYLWLTAKDKYYNVRRQMFINWFNTQIEKKSWLTLLWRVNNVCRPKMTSPPKVNCSTIFVTSLVFKSLKGRVKYAWCHLWTTTWKNRSSQISLIGCTGGPTRFSPFCYRKSLTIHIKFSGK